MNLLFLSSFSHTFRKRTEEELIIHALAAILPQSLQKYHSFLTRRGYREEEEMPYFSVFPRVGVGRHE